MSIDLALFEFVNRFVGRSSFVDFLFVIFARHLAYVIILTFLFIVFQGENWQGRFYRFALGFLSMIVAGGMVAQSIKYFFFRVRPFETLGFSPLINGVSRSAFPSTHASLFFALATALFFVNKRVGVWFYIAAVVMGVARVFVGVHWPSDIIAGAVVGIGSAFLVRKLLVSTPATSHIADLES